MSNVIQFLERLGQDAQSKSAIPDAVARAREQSEISPVVADALLIGVQVQLVALIGARTNVSCMVFPAKPDDDESEEKRKDDEESPGDDKEKMSFSSARRAAIAS